MYKEGSAHEPVSGSFFVEMWRKMRCGGFGGGCDAVGSAEDVYAMGSAGDAYSYVMNEEYTYVDRSVSILGVHEN